MTAQQANRHDPECIFCKIARGEMNTEFVYRDDRVVVFKDMNPQAEQHVLIVPVNHYHDLNDLAEAAGSSSEAKEDWQAVLHAVERTAEALELTDDSYRIINNRGKSAGQSVFHIHLHLLSDGKLAERLV